jgi:hypothetical protein
LSPNLHLSLLLLLTSQLERAVPLPFLLICDLFLVISILLQIYPLQLTKRLRRLQIHNIINGKHLRNSHYMWRQIPVGSHMGLLAWPLSCA